MVTTLAEFKRLILNHLCWVCKYCNAVETFVMTFTTLHVQSGSNHDVRAQGGSVVDVLCCQPIKLFQVFSTSEFHEY